MLLCTGVCVSLFHSAGCVPKRGIPGSLSPMFAFPRRGNCLSEQVRAGFRIRTSSRHTHTQLDSGDLDFNGIYVYGIGKPATGFPFFFISQLQLAVNIILYCYQVSSIAVNHTLYKGIPRYLKNPPSPIHSYYDVDAYIPCAVLCIPVTPP